MKKRFSKLRYLLIFQRMSFWLSVFQHSLDAHPHPLGSTPNHLPWVFNDAVWCWVLLQTHRLEWLETPYDFMVSKKCKVYQSQQACMSYCTVCSLHMLAFLVHWICTGTEQIADRQRGRFNMFPLELMPHQFISLFMICHQSSPSFWNPAQVLFLGPWRVATCSRWSSWWHCRSLDYPCTASAAGGAGIFFFQLYVPWLSSDLKRKMGIN